MEIVVANKYDWTHPNAGGAEVNLRETLTRLVKRGHNVNLICGRYPGAEGKTVLEGVNVYRFGLPGRTNEILVNTLGQVYLNWMIFKLDPDVFYSVHSPFGWFTFFTNKVTVFHHINGEILFDSLSFPLDYMSYLFEKLGVFFAKKGGTVISVSPSTTEDLVRNGLDRDKIVEIRNGVDTEKFSPGEKAEEPRVLYVGRIEKSKGVDLIPDIYKFIDQSFNQDFRLDIVGDGKMRGFIENFASGEDNVFYHGFVSEEEKKRFLRKAWVSIVPSRREGWGLTVMEANASGTPAVGFRIGGLSYSIRDGETGRLVSAYDLESFAEEVTKILEDDDYRNDLSDNAREWAEEYDWEGTTDKLESVLKRNI